MSSPTPFALTFPQRIALFFGAVFLVFGVHITYFPLWLASRGLSEAEIGLLTALPILVRVFSTPWMAAWADRDGVHRAMVVWLAAVSVALVLGVWASSGFFWLLITVVAYSVAIVTVLPLVDTLAVSGVRDNGHDYGQMRLWGSATFLVATLATGALFDLYGPPAIIAMLVGSTVATAATAFLLPAPAGLTRAQLQVAQPLMSRAPRADRRGVRRLMSLPVFALFIVAVGAIQASHAAFYTFGALHLKGQGVSGTAFGTLWAVAILAEIAVFARSAPFVARIGPIPLLVLGGVAAILRWATMSFDPPYAVLLVLQALHALTYGATHLGAIHFIAKAVPQKGSGTAQALYSAIGNGLATAGATYVAGLVYPGLGADTFIVMGLIAATGTAAAVYVHRAWDGKPLM